MATKVLVAYASRYNSTKGIANFIAERLREHGVHVDVRDVDSVRNPKDYDAFVIGSALYMFHWLKEAREFVSRNHDLLASRPVWLFSSGPLGAQTRNAAGSRFARRFRTAGSRRAEGGCQPPKPPNLLRSAGQQQAGVRAQDYSQDAGRA